MNEVRPLERLSLDETAGTKQATKEQSRWLAADAPACFAALAAFAFGSGCWQSDPAAVMLFAACFAAAGIWRILVPSVARQATWASALAWSALGSWTVVAQLSPASHFIYALLTAGLTASAARGMASDLRFVRGYLAVMLLPASGMEAFAGHYAMAAGVAGLFGFFVLRADQWHGEFWHIPQAASPQATASSARSKKIAEESCAPLRGIARMTVLLLDTPLSPDQREYLEIIRDSASMLRHSINNLLVEEAAPAQESFDPTAILAGVADMFAPKAAAKRIELLATAGPGLDGALTGDPQRIGQALANLVSNAIKFTEQGRVEIHADCAGEAASRELVFEVCDTGIGIAPERIAGLFAASPAGTGLSIAATLARQMGGSIGATSQPEHGSRFWLRMPAPAPSSVEEVTARDSTRVLA